MDTATRTQELQVRLRKLMACISPAGTVIAGMEFIGRPENGYRNEVIPAASIIKEIRKAKAELEQLNG